MHPLPPAVRCALAAFSIAVVAIAGCAPASETGPSDPQPSSFASDATQTPAPLPSAETAAVTPSASASSPPTGEASIKTTWLPYGQWATVSADDLNVRGAAGVGHPSDSTVSAGDSVFVLGPGSVDVDGFQWLQVAYGAVLGDDGLVQADGIGWLAAASSDDTTVRHLELWAADCPDLPIDAPTLAGLTARAITICDLGQLTGLEGMLNQPIHGPLSPFTYEPAWLWASVWYLADPEVQEYAFVIAGWSVALHLPPELDTSALRRGDIVRVTGHVGDDAADECRINSSAEPGAPQPTEAQQQEFRLQCAAKFVVDQLEVIDHVELPEL